MQSLIQAMNSSDLAEVPEGIGDIDWIRAAGMAGQRHSTAVSLWQLCELGDLRAGRQAVAGAMAEAVKLGNEERAAEAAATVIEWMMHPTCKPCHGRGFDLIPGAGRPTLSDHACTHCGGTGQRPRPWRDDEKALYDRLTELQAQAAAAIIKRIKDRAGA
jgi:hypothetical protein